MKKPKNYSYDMDGFIEYCLDDFVNMMKWYFDSLFKKRGKR